MGTTPPTAIGIDLGTSFCSCAVVVDGQVEVLKDEFGHENIPSYVAFTDDGRLVGTPAKEYSAVDPSNTVHGMKRFMGTSENHGTELAVRLKLSWEISRIFYPQTNQSSCSIIVKCKGKKLDLAPEQVSAMLLSKLKKLAEKRLSCRVNAAVITVPAFFNSYQRQATVDAGKIAGFQHIHLINEPTAIALTYSKELCNNENKSSVLIVDVGGGFMSLTVASVSNSQVQIIESVTEPFGGLDLDANFFHLCSNKCARQINDLSPGGLHLSVEKAKETLSSANQACVTALLKNGRKETIRVNKYDFSQLVNSELKYKLNGMLRNITPRNVDCVILSGGGSKNPFIGEYLRGNSRASFIHSDELSQAVAKGAALKATLHFSSTSSWKMQVNDVIHRNVYLTNKSNNNGIPIFLKTASILASEVETDSKIDYRVTETPGRFTATIGKINGYFSLFGLRCGTGSAYFYCDDDQILRGHPLKNKEWVKLELFVSSDQSLLNSMIEKESSFLVDDKKEDFRLNRCHNFVSEFNQLYQIASSNHSCKMLMWEFNPLKNFVTRIPVAALAEVESHFHQLHTLKRKVLKICVNYESLTTSASKSNGASTVKSVNNANSTNFDAKTSSNNSHSSFTNNDISAKKDIKNETAQLPPDKNKTQFSVISETKHSNQLYISLSPNPTASCTSQRMEETASHPLADEEHHKPLSSKMLSNSAENKTTFENASKHSSIHSHNVRKGNKKSYVLKGSMKSYFQPSDCKPENVPTKQPKILVPVAIGKSETFCSKLYQGPTRKSPAIGIDFGSSKCCVGVLVKGHVKILENETGQKTTPSVVLFSDRERLIGEEARNVAIFYPKDSIMYAKKLLQEKFDSTACSTAKTSYFNSLSEKSGKACIKVKYRQKELHISPEQISSILLKKMKSIAENYLKCPVTDAVIAVPAFFNNKQRQATLDAAEIAGLNVLKLINEPTAAAITYKDNNRSVESKNVLVFDAGGGGLNVALVDIRKDKIDVKGIGGTPEVSGEGIVDSMMNHFIVKMKESFGPSFEISERNQIKLRNACEISKQKLQHQLPSWTETILNVYGEKDFDCSIDQSLFRKLADGIPNAVRKVLDELLANTEVQKNQVSEIIFCGGSSRLKIIQETLSKYFDGKNFNTIIDAVETVAVGATIQAGILSGESHDTIMNAGDIISKPSNLKSVNAKWISIPKDEVTKILMKKKCIYVTPCGVLATEGEYEKHKADVNIAESQLEVNQFDVDEKNDRDLCIATNAFEEFCLKTKTKFKKKGEYFSFDKDLKEKITSLCDVALDCVSDEEITRNALDTKKGEIERSLSEAKTEYMRRLEERKDTLKKSCTKVKEDLAGDKFLLVECSLKQQVESLCEETLQWLLKSPSNAVPMTDVQKMQEEIESSVKKVEKRHQIIIEERKRLKEKKVSFKLYCFQIQKCLLKFGKYCLIDDELKQAVDGACERALESVDAEGVTCDAIQRMQKKIESKLERIDKIHSRKMSEKQHIVAINSFIKKCHGTKLQFSEGGKYRELNGNDRMKVIKFCDEAVKELFENDLSEKFLNSLDLQFNKTLTDANECHNKVLREKAQLEKDKEVLLGSCCDVELALSTVQLSHFQDHLKQALKSLTNETRVGLSKDSLSRSEFEAMKSNYFVRLKDINEQQKQYEEDRKLAEASQDFKDFCYATKNSFSGSGLHASVGDEIRTEILSACDEALDWMACEELTVRDLEKKKQEMELLVKNSLKKYRRGQEKILLAKKKVLDSLLELKKKFSVDGKHGNASKCGRKAIIDMCNEGQKLKSTATVKQLEELLKETENFSQQVIESYEEMEKRLDAYKNLQLLCLRSKLNFDSGGKYANVSEGKKVILLCDLILVEMKEKNLSRVNIENKQSHVVSLVEKLLK